MSEEPGIPGERVIRLGPLSLEPGTGRISDAEALFLDRAARVGAAQGLESARQLDLIRLICARLDGNPLAIELAAARLAVLSVEEVAERVEDPLRLLRQQGGGRRLPSMEDSLDWTFDLCSPHGRTLLTDSGVFRGSFTVAAAAAVTGVGAQALDALHELVAKSVLIPVHAPGQRRFRIPEVVRHYAEARSQSSGRRSDLEFAHATWYAQRGAELELRWIGPGQIERFRESQADLPNTRVALQRILGGSGAVDQELLLGLAALPNPQQWWTAGRIEEGLIWLNRVLEVATDPELRARTVYACATYTAALGDEGRTRELLLEVDDVSGVLDRPFDRASAAFVRGFAAIVAGDPVAAGRVARLGLGELDADAVEPTAFRLLEVVAYANGILGRADDTAEACREIIRRSDSCSGEVYYRSFAEHLLGALAWRRGDLEGACTLLAHAFDVIREVPLRPENTDTLLVAANVAYEIGGVGAAARLLGAAQASRRTELPAASNSPESRDHLAQRYEELQREHRHEWILGREMTVASACELALETFAAAIADGGSTATGARLPTWLLTQREKEVAGLLLHGYTNRQIASHLTVSVRTAEGHVERLRAKLAVSSRQDIVARLRAGGMAPPALNA